MINKSAVVKLLQLNFIKNHNMLSGEVSLQNDCFVLQNGQRTMPFYYLIYSS